MTVVPIPGVTYTYDESLLAFTAAGRPRLPLTPPQVHSVIAGAQPLGSVSASGQASSRVYVSKSGSDSGSGTIASPYLTVQRAIDTAATGATIVVRGGSYHESLSSPSSKRLTITCQPGEAVWFDGSYIVGGWQQSGSAWVAPYSVTLNRFGVTGFGGADYRNYPDQVWINGAPLTQIADNATPAAGQFSVNQSADTLTIGDDPTGKQVRAVDLTTMLTASGRCDLIGIGVRRYSPQSVEGFNAFAYFGGTSAGSVIDNCHFEWSAMAGLQVTKASIRVTNNTIRHLGYSGIMGTTCDSAVIANNLIFDHNRGQWAAAPATGGMKFTRADGMQIYSNMCADPVAPCVGLWLDVSCTRFVMYGNSASTPGSATGILIEECDGGYYNNTQYTSWVVGNWIYGGSISNTVSGNVSYYNNEIENYSIGFRSQQDREKNNGIPAANRTQEECPWYCTDVVLANTKFGTPSASGLKLQIIAYDDGINELRGVDMFKRMGGNWFYPAPPGSMAQLGKIDGFRDSFNTPAALAAAGSVVGGPWGSKIGTNYQGTTAPSVTIAEPLPANVATMLGSSVPRIGPNPDRKPVRSDAGGYDVVIGIIQSNARGAATDFDPTGQDAYPNRVDMWRWSDSQILPALEPLPNLDNFAGMGILNRFAQLYRASNLGTGRRLLLVNAAHGGTGFSTPGSNSKGSLYNWDRTTSNDQYNLPLRTVENVRQILGSLGDGDHRIVACLANHGSTDGTNNMPKATFKAKLQDWIGWWQGQMGTVPYLMMQMRPDLAAAETRHRIIDDAQAETATEMAGSKVRYSLSPAGSTYYKADAVHFNAAGVREIGSRLHNLYTQIGA